MAYGTKPICVLRPSLDFHHENGSEVHLHSLNTVDLLIDMQGRNVHLFNWYIPVIGDGQGSPLTSNGRHLFAIK